MFEQEAQGRHMSGHRLKRKGAGSKSRITRVGGARGSASRRTCAGVGVGVHRGTDREHVHAQRGGRFVNSETEIT